MKVPLILGKLTLKVQHALSNTVLEPEVEQLTAAVIATGGVAPGNLEIWITECHLRLTLHVLFSLWPTFGLLLLCAHKLWIWERHRVADLWKPHTNISKCRLRATRSHSLVFAHWSCILVTVHVCIAREDDGNHIFFGMEWKAGIMAFAILRWAMPVACSFLVAASCLSFPRRNDQISCICRWSLLAILKLL